MKRPLCFVIDSQENNLEGNDAFWGLADGYDERYLCLKNGEYYSFRFVAGTSTTKAGEMRLYYVRLVKSYRYVPE